jgi:hypothetical protein
VNKVYVYGLRPPVENEALVDQQIRLAHEYQNRLIEVERTRRTRVRQTLSEAGLAPYEAAAEQHWQAYSDLQAAAKKDNAAAHSRVETRAQEKEIKAAKKVATAATTELKAKRKEICARPEIAELLAQHDTSAELNAKAAYFGSGLYWGQRAIIDQAMELAKKSRTDPRFQRWTGEGAVAVQIQHGMTAEQAFGQDTRFRIDPIPAEAWDRRRDPAQRTRVRLRVGSVGRDPVWATWPAILHRPLPEGAQIMWAKVIRTRIEAHYRWELHLSLRLPDPAPSELPKVLAVDVGWRQLEDGGLRVAYWVGGKTGEICTPVEIIQGLRKCEDLQEIRDKAFNEIRDRLAVFLGVSQALTPAWLVEATEHLDQWKSEARLAALAVRWRDLRWDGDSTIYEALETWRKHDKHLWTWQENQREKSLRRRRDAYRVAAHDLAQHFGTLVLEDFDLTVHARRPKVEDDDKDERGRILRKQKSVAAAGELRLALVNAFTSAGGKVVKLDPADTTKICWLCGAKDAWDRAAEDAVERVCCECGTLVDQDENACRMLLARFEQQGAAQPSAEENQRSAGRWQKRKAKRSQNAPLDGAAG